MSKAVAKLDDSANMLAEFQDDFAKDVGTGGKVTSADLQLPFLRVLQGLSPQLNRDKPEYIKGAAMGDLCLTIYDLVWDGREDGVSIVPCHYTRVFVEWRPVELGGGMVNTYQPEDPTVASAKRDDKGKLWLPNGNQLIETAYHAVLVRVGDKLIPAVMPLKSTMLKASKKLNNAVTTFEYKGQLAPRWIRWWRMTSIQQSKLDKSWAVPVFTPLEGTVDRDTYLQAREWAISAEKSSNFAQADAAQDKSTPRESSEEF